MKESWYLIQFRPNSSSIAKTNLDRQGFKTFLPLQLATDKKKSKFITSLKPLFPGYMFVCIDNNSKPWNKINSTLGVSRLVIFDNKPRPIPSGFVSALLKRCDRNGKLLPRESLFPGDKVEISSGPFSDLVATIEAQDTKNRIWIIMELMGQRTRVSVNLDQVKSLH